MDPVPQQLFQALSDRYRFERTAGRGGMATVYAARDLRHGREVALKVLLPELAASLGTTRFLNEIQIAARLTHPHIVPLYDSGEAAGFLYYVMPMIGGESLRACLNAQGCLALPRAVTIASQVADALAYAHEAGVVHRDIKPENILLFRGHAYVTDFGIAKAVSRAGGIHLTRTGFPLGTPGYMSPEQAAGIADLGATSDIYGLGCVLYEMVVGETPGLWLTPEAVRLGRFIDASPDHRRMLDELPGRLEQVLAKALAMRPQDRFRTARRFGDAAVAALQPGPRRSMSEVDAIVRRASALHEERRTNGEDLSLADLQEIGVSVGIPTGLVRDAIEEVVAEAGDGGATDRTGIDVSDIIGRAARLQIAREDDEDESLTMGGVEQVAAQVGIAPEHVRQAALELSRGSLPNRNVPPQLISTRPTRVAIERIVQGTMSAAEYPRLLEAIHRRLGMLGTVHAFGRTIRWTSTGEREVHVVIGPRAGEMRFQFEEIVHAIPGRLAGGALGAVGGMFCGIALWLGVGMPQAPPLAVFSFMCAAAGAFFVSGSMAVQKHIMAERELEALADALAALVERHAAPRSADDQT
ncbi:MAG TPA: serine/threonine-protein kinase [Gemmatimonadales bacterium]